MAESKLRALPGGVLPPVELPPDDQLWTVEDAASYLRMSTHWIYKAVEARKVPYRRIGSGVRFIPSELRAWAQGSRD